MREHVPADADADSVKVLALRLFGAVDRGTSKVFLDWMVPKLVEAGGGGAIENTELWRLLGNKNADGTEKEWKVRWGSITHTDAARAYSNLSRRSFEETPELNNEANRRSLEALVETVAQQGARLAAELEAGFHEARRIPEFAKKYKSQHYSATHIVHKKKKGLRRSFVKLVKVLLFDGRVAWVKAGTQQIDGLWAGIRSAVSRGSVNTWRTGILNRSLRVHQWKRWLGPGVDKLSCLGPALQAGRSLLKSKSEELETVKLAAREAREHGRDQRRWAGLVSGATRRSAVQGQGVPAEALEPSGGQPPEQQLVPQRKRLRRLED